jgi:hypothetical protein
MILPVCQVRAALIAEFPDLPQQLEGYCGLFGAVAARVVAEGPTNVARYCGQELGC